MSRVFCLSSNVTTEPYPVYPLGMAVIAGALARCGHEVRQFDFLAAGKSEEALLSAVRVFAPDCICLSLRNIDNVDSFSAESAWYVGQAKRLVELLRTVSAAPVIVGGPGFSILPEEILVISRRSRRSAKERGVCNIVAALAAGEAVPALQTGRAPLPGADQGSPLLTRELVDFYVGQTGMVNLQTKRGCPHDCVYCTYPSLEGRHFRPRAAGIVVDDIERIGRDFGVSGFFFTDSVFNDPRGEYLELAEEILRRNLKISFCAFFRPQGIGRPELALLKRAGLHAAELGTDAASNVTLAGTTRASPPTSTPSTLPCASASRPRTSSSSAAPTRPWRRFTRGWQTSLHWSTAWSSPSPAFASSPERACLSGPSPTASSRPVRRCSSRSTTSRRRSTTRR
jgi:radical SAM superfamily enzyme YgiQ (UPF0313 family)